MIPAKYTVVLKSLLDDPQAKAAIDRALSTYPLYQPEKAYDLIPPREEINRKLLNHYKYREIFCSAPGRFIDELEITMREIMPRYNELLKTVAIMADIEDPFGNLDVVETFEQETTGMATSQGSTNTTQNTKENQTATNEAHTSETANGKNLEADTPQGSIVTAPDITTVGNASKAIWNKDTSETDSSGSGATETNSELTSEASSDASSETTGTTKHTLKRKGNQGVNTYAHDMNEFRISIMDVVDQIINDSRIQELFFMLY